MGLATNLDLPLFDDYICLRPTDQIVSRALVLFVVISCAYRFSKKSALDWIKTEKLENNISNSEKYFILNDSANKSYFQKQVEALNAFAWALGFINFLDFDRGCDNLLVTNFPDIKNAESSVDFKAIASVRSATEVISTCDLAYCLHWAITDAVLTGKNSHKPLSAHVIIERGRALEWILNSDDWDSISLDV